MDGSRDEPLIHGIGTPEKDWMRCASLQHVRQVPPEHLVAKDARMVVVAPHPDDEVLGAGGLMAIRAAMGKPLGIVAVTDGEHSHPARSADCVRSIRINELHDALCVLGISPRVVTRLHIADGEVGKDRLALHRFLMGYVRAHTDVLLCPWRLDGHPDHETTAEVVLEVAAEADCRVIEYPIWGWHWARPEQLPWDRAAALSLAPLTRSKKAHAIRAFGSQITDQLGDVILAAGDLAHFDRPFELFLT